MLNKKLILAVVFFISFYSYSQTNEELNQKINHLSDEIEQMKLSKGARDVKLGGYGEIIYSKNEKGESGTEGGEPTSDNTRFVLYVGYDFSKQWSLVSEIEVEHASEIYMEQAYLNFSSSDVLHLRAGTLLIPMGHLNLTHEPTTFFGTERTESETRIIPSTWRENGVGLYGQKEKLSYYLYYVNGLKASAVQSSAGVRKGRQKASNANSHKGAFVGRLDYNLSVNSELGVSIYKGKLNDTVSNVDHSVYDIHYKAQFGAIYTRILWTQLTLTNTDDLNIEKTANYAKVMDGHYVELGYDLNHGKSEYKIIPFLRHEVINTQAKVEEGVTKDLSQNQEHQTFGFLIKPVENISLKLDYTVTKNDAKTGQNSWNFGLGWNF